jgi:hypothetical protein
MLSIVVSSFGWLPPSLFPTIQENVSARAASGHDLRHDRLQMIVGFQLFGGH